MFRQLLFDLEDEVFGYFKDWAASTVLDKNFKRVYEIRRGWGHFIPGRRRYEVGSYMALLYLRFITSLLVAFGAQPAVRVESSCTSMYAVLSSQRPRCCFFRVDDRRVLSPVVVANLCGSAFAAVWLSLPLIG